MEWIKRRRSKVAAGVVFECARCNRRVTRRSPTQVYCADCRRELNRARARAGMRIRRSATRICQLELVTD